MRGRREHGQAASTLNKRQPRCILAAGTLTENRMTIVKFWLGGVEAAVSGDKGASRDVVPAALLERLCDHLSINSTAVTTISNKGLKV